MKTLTLFVFLIISMSSFSQFRLKRVLKDLANHPEPIAIFDYETRIERIGYQRQEKNKFLVDFCEARVSEDYNNLTATIESTKGTVSLSQLQDQAKRLLDRWDTKLSEKDTNYINEKYPFVIKTIRGWYNTIQTFIEPTIPDDSTTVPNLDSMNQVIENLKDSLALQNYTNEYFDSSRLKLISKEFSDYMESLQDEEINGEKISYRLIFERSGPGGTDLIITIEPNFEKHQKYFQKGVYEYLAINDVFESFSISVRDKIRDSILVEAWVQGEADGYPLTKQNSTFFYSNMSNIWGIISDTTYSGKLFNLAPNEPIDNEELAFLRAWNAKYIFEKTVERKCVTRINAIDYSRFDPSKKDPQGTYRNATIKVFLLDYFFTDYSDLIDRPNTVYQKKIIKDKSGQ